LIDAIDVSTIIGIRDRALIGVMVYSFARVSAALGMNGEDYFSQGRRMWFRLHEKGGKFHALPAHHKAEEYLDAFLLAAGTEPSLPIFRTIGPGKNLTGNRMTRTDALRMMKRRAKQAGIETHVCCHTWRATGITAYLQNSGSLEHARQIAFHESAKTTKLYDRRQDAVSLDEIERIRI
jgi:integrase